MPQAEPLWPVSAPGALGTPDDFVPTLTRFPAPADTATGAAFIVCPGGGYVNLAPHEADPVAEWFNSLGIHGFVLRYRRSPLYKHPAPLHDAQRAIRTVRNRAVEWGVDPQRIGILGFSAGGHLASTAGTHFDAGNPVAADPIDRVSSRPDLMILVYPVVSFEQHFHSGSMRNLIGENPSAELRHSLSNEAQVSPQTPPTFLIHSANDGGVPVENSISFAMALRRAGVPFELHVIEKGPHGFGLGGNDPALSLWPRNCAAWLAARGFGRRV